MRWVVLAVFLICGCKKQTESESVAPTRAAGLGTSTPSLADVHYDVAGPPEAMVRSDFQCPTGDIVNIGSFVSDGRLVVRQLIACGVTATYARASDDTWSRRLAEPVVSTNRVDVSKVSEPRAVALMIAKRQSHFLNCYESTLLGEPEVSGALTLEWELAEVTPDVSSRVTSIRIVSNETSSEELAACVVKRIKGWRFDGVHGVVSWRFVFGKEASGPVEGKD